MSVFYFYFSIMAVATSFDGAILLLGLPVIGVFGFLDEGGRAVGVVAPVAAVLETATVCGCTVPVVAPPPAVSVDR